MDALRTQAGPSPVTAELGEIISYDTHLRALLAEKNPALNDQTDFLLGHPFTASLAHLGLEITSKS